MESTFSEAFIKQVFDLSPLPIIVMDADSHAFIECNQAAISLHGFTSREDIIGKVPADVSPPTQYDGVQSGQKAECYIAKAIAEGSVTFEWRQQRPDGTGWDAEVRLLYVTICGKPLLQFTMLDITERKLMERMQGVLHDLMLELNSCSDLRDGLSKVLSSVLQLGCLDSGGVYDVDQTDGSLDIVSSFGLSKEFVARVSHFAADSPSAKAVGDGAIKFGEYSALRVETDPVREHEGLKAMALLPVISNGKMIALLNLASHTHSTIPESTKKGLETISFQIGGSLLRLRSDAALRESNEILRQFIDNSPIYAFIKEVAPAESRVIQASECYTQMIGISGRDMVGKRMEELFPADLAAKMAADDWEAFQNNRILKLDEELNGRCYTSIKFPIVRTGKRLLAGFTIDVTDQRRAEEALKGEKRFVEKILDGMPIMFCLFDIDLRLQRWNAKFAELLGGPGVELDGISLDELDPNGLVSKRVKRMVASRGADWQINIEIPIADRRGQRIPYMISGIRFDTDQGPMLMGVGIDISDRKRAEAESERLQQRLNQVQQLESLGVFAGGIAHDFNNLLGGIFGYIDMASTEKSDGTRDGYIAKAMGTIDRARALTQQLLTFAKGGAPVKKVESLFPFIKETAQFALSGASVSCSFDVPKDLWDCDFDRNQIGQVVDNIVINALQAMPSGGAIRVSARNTAIGDKGHPILKPGNYVQLSIRDSGIGIPKEYLPKIFDPFYTTKPKGHGLGLATCFSIIHRHDGCIDVESEPGIGSTFHVFLPASVGPASSASAAATPDHKGSGVFLVMDDEEVLRETIGKMLESFGYSVSYAASGGEAVDLFKECLAGGRAMDGMIFDLTIPGGMGGKEAVAEIRKLSADIPVFVSSGYGDDPIMANPAEYGFSGSLRKPFRRKDLAFLLSEHMKAAGG